MRSRRENQTLLSAARSHAVYTLMRLGQGLQWTGVDLSPEICNMARPVRCPSREPNLALGSISIGAVAVPYNEIRVKILESLPAFTPQLEITQGGTAPYVCSRMLSSVPSQHATTHKAAFTEHQQLPASRISLSLHPYWHVNRQSRMQAVPPPVTPPPAQTASEHKSPKVGDSKHVHQEHLRNG